MNAKRMAGLAVLATSALYMALVGAVGGWLGASPALHLSLEEMNHTAWRLGGPLFMFWMLNGFLGPILAGVGTLLYVQAKGVHIWLFGMGLFLTIVIDQALIPSGYYRPVYGTGGALIVAFFLAVLWVWARQYQTLDGPARSAACLQLVSYVFFFISAWVTCARTGERYYEALTDYHKAPASLMAYLVLGWLFLFLSHFVSARARHAEREASVGT